MRKIKKIYFLLLLGLLIRLVFLYPQFSGDVKNHFAWGNGFLASPLGFYSRHFPGFNDPNYPPLAIIIFAASNLLHNGVAFLFGYLNQTFPFFPSFLVPLFSSENMRMGFLKIPAILADLGIGWLIYKNFRPISEKRGLLVSGLYLLNPAVFYVSSVWGQIESVTIFFLVLSLLTVTLDKIKSKWLSITIFSLSIITKQTAIWFLPIFLILWLKELKPKEVLIGTASALSLFFISFLPFGVAPIASIKIYLSTLSGSSDVVADAAWNLWSYFYPMSTSDSIQLGFFTVRSISIALLVVLLSVFVINLSVKYSILRFYKYLFLWSLAVFFLQTRVHERHLAFSVVFLLFAGNLSFIHLVEYLSLSLFHLYNLLYSLKLPFI